MNSVNGEEATVRGHFNISKEIRKNRAMGKGAERGQGERVRVNGNVKIAWNALA